MSEPSIREEFLHSADSLMRVLSVNGISGQSMLSVLNDLPENAPHEILQTAWDESFLRTKISYPTAMASPRTIRIADVFCGAGGLSYGVRDAISASGLKAENVLAVDVDSVAMEVYRRNFDPRYFSTCDLWTSVTRSYSTKNLGSTFTSRPAILNQELQASQGIVDLLLGGPPCEGHSNSNNVTRRNDPRNRYYVLMPALAVALGAKAVIVENVPGVQHDDRGVLQSARDLFVTSGYHVSDTIVDGVSLGLAQTRKRHILVASTTRQPMLEASIEMLARSSKDLRWAIGDLMETHSRDLIDLGAELSDVNRSRIKYLFDNDLYELPDEHRPDSHKNGHTYPSIYGRLHWDAPAGTVTTGFNTPGRGRHIHPELQRTITPHEAARLQGFPDEFDFKLINGDTPSRTSLANMIGDAVPPQMGYVAAVAALGAMDLGSI